MSSRTLVKLVSLLVPLALAATGAAAHGLDQPEGHGTLPLSAGTDHASDGTLPLKLGGSDGTLPLRLSGSAIAGTAQLLTEITITQAATQAFNDTSGVLKCQTGGPDVSKHVAAGSILVGGASYEIRGICFDAGNRNMEIVGERAGGNERSFFVGPLGADQPTELSGSLMLQGQPPLSGHFTFDVHSPNG